MIRHRRKARSATLTLILLNVAIFFIVFPIVLFKRDLMDYLALKPIAVAQGQMIWTLVTSMFMHGGPFHLFANMISLMFIGGFLEKLIGKKRFLGIYFASALMGALFFVVLALLFGGQGNGIFGDPSMGAVGASAAIFGIAGMLAILTPKLPVYIMFIPIAMPMWFGVILIMFGLWSISAAANLPVGNTAHFGGLLAGIAYAIYLKIKYKRKTHMISMHYR
ncbi:rhomboid family intramembrane serine protease [Nanoarchaeota archaeon]